MEFDLNALISTLEGQNNPSDLANIKVRLAAEYARLCGILEGVLVGKSKKWEEFRKTCTSDTQAERKWEMTEEGMGETVCRLRMKKIEKLLSAVSSKIAIATEELKGNL